MKIITDIYEDEKYEEVYRDVLERTLKCLKTVKYIPNELLPEQDFINECIYNRKIYTFEDLKNECVRKGNFEYISDLDFINSMNYIHGVNINKFLKNRFSLKSNKIDYKALLANVISIIEEADLDKSILLNNFKNLEILSSFKTFFNMFKFIQMSKKHSFKYKDIDIMNPSREYELFLSQFENFFFLYGNHKYELIEIIGEDYFKDMFNDILADYIIHYSESKLNEVFIRTNMYFFIKNIDTYKWIDKKNINTLAENNIFYKEHAEIDEEYLSEIVFKQFNNDDCLII